MSNTLSLALVVLAVALVVFGVLEHFYFRISIIPHFAIALGVLAFVLATWGLYGRINKSSGDL